MATFIEQLAKLVEFRGNGSLSEDEFTKAKNILFGETSQRLSGSGGDQKVAVVTGATGYIGCVTMEELVKAGYKVRATVRDPSSYKCDFIKENFPSVELYKADLMKDGDFDAVCKGADYMVHVAAPVLAAWSIKDKNADMLDPHIKGTENVLGSAIKAGVKRVVMTSSIVAVFDQMYSEIMLEKDNPDPDRVFGPKDWNESAIKAVESGGKEGMPSTGIAAITGEASAWYCYSKTVAEKKARAMCEEAGVEICTIHPGITMGRSAKGYQRLQSATQTMPFALVSGKSFLGLKDIAKRALAYPAPYGIIHSIDVAQAHVKACTVGSWAFNGVQGERFILSRDAQLSTVLTKYILDDPKYKDIHKNIATQGTWEFEDGQFGSGGPGSKCDPYLQKFDASAAKKLLGRDFASESELMKDAVDWFYAAGVLPEGDDDYLRKWGYAFDP